MSNLLKGIWKEKSLILEGLKNSIFIKDEIEKLAKERYSICEVCDNNSTNAKIKHNYKTSRLDEHCTICKCNLHAATRTPQKECPIKKWLAVATIEENNKIQDLLNLPPDEKEQ